MSSDQAAEWKVATDSLIKNKTRKLILIPPGLKGNGWAREVAECVKAIVNYDRYIGWKRISSSELGK